MNRPRSPLILYEVFGAGTWTAIITSSADILKGTPYIVPMLLMLFGGAAIFLILLPMTVFRSLLPPR